MAHQEPEDGQSHSYEGQVPTAERDRVLRAILTAGAQLGEELGMSSDDWDEATQALAVKMNRHMARFVRFSEGDLRAYVRTSLHNWQNDADDAERLHAQGNVTAVRAQEAVFRSQNRPDRPVQTAYIAERIQAALLQLPDRQRQVFLLTEEEQLSRAQIAKQLDIGEEAVKKALSRARQHLRELLEDVLGDRIEPDKYENLATSTRHASDDADEVDHE